jgi:methylmalonyl-CoA mutase C-terminal domain/subunit
MDRRIRVIIAKLGLDGHNRGVRVISAGLRDRGFEVIYTGIRQTAKKVAWAALQEDVDAVGVSSLVGAHLVLMEQLSKEMSNLGINDVVLFVGGIIPKEDDKALYDIGVKGIFRPGTKISEIAEFLKTECRKRREN